MLLQQHVLKLVKPTATATGEAQKTGDGNGDTGEEQREDGEDDDRSAEEEEAEEEEEPPGIQLRPIGRLTSTKKRP